MTERDWGRLVQQLRGQTARWNVLRARFAALPPQPLRVPVKLLEDLAAVGTGARRVGPLPRFGVKA